MTTDFFKFPHTPHLAWLGAGGPREDKVMGTRERAEFLDGDLIVEEKVDGANLGFSVDGHGELRAQNRGSFVSPRSQPQFETLGRWMGGHRKALTDALGTSLMLFGEWCFAVHSIKYDALPDWFLAFDVFDRDERRFWSVERRDDLLADLGVAPVPRLGAGRFSLDAVWAFVGASRLAVGSLAEGVYVRRDEGQWLSARAKLVRPEFTQAIGEHWSKRSIERNELGGEARK